MRRLNNIEKFFEDLGDEIQWVKKKEKNMN